MSAMQDGSMETNEYASLTAVEIGNLIRGRQISPLEVTRAALRRLDEVEPSINAFVTVTADLALDQARKAEDAVMRGGRLGPLHGIPTSVKDLIAVGGVRQTFGSRTRADHIAITDAPSVERLKDSGAVIVGKTTTTEFGVKAAGDSPLTGLTRNPWNPERTTGGSSCGAAASVAAGVTPFGLGTDGGGSIRIPSAFCGLFGVKAQFARIPVHPPSATPTLGHVGPLARSVRDAALVLNALSGHDERDPASVNAPPPDFLRACDAGVQGLRIAWSPTLGYARPTAEVVQVCSTAVRTFEDMGCKVEEVDQVLEGDPFDIFVADFYAGIGVQLGEALRSHRDILDRSILGVLDSAVGQSLDDYMRSIFGRYQLRDRLRKFFARFDLLMTPTVPVPAFEVSLTRPRELPERSIVNWVFYTYPFNLTGQPAASIPCGFTADGLPLGLQIVSRPLFETDLLRAAAAFEAARPWRGRVPVITSPGDKAQNNLPSPSLD